MLRCYDYIRVHQALRDLRDSTLQATLTPDYSIPSLSKGGSWLSLSMAFFIACYCLAGSRIAVAQDKEFVIATKVAPPFAMLDADQQWHGLSITLWETLAARLNIQFRFQQATLTEMIEGVADGRFDASISAITITHERELLVDFSHPFYTTGYGIVVPHMESSWWSMLNRLVSVAFLQAIGLLILLLAFVGFCFWLAERRQNPKEFRSGIHGVGDGFWLSAVTMTTTGYGDMAPRSWTGRLIGLVWMFSALIITSTFTGMIASSLTTDRLERLIEGPDDLSGLTTGSINNSASDTWLTIHGVDFVPFQSVQAGIEGVAAGDIRSFVYDRPLLRYLVEKSYSDTTELVPGTFGRQDYGIVFPQGSKWREPLNRELLTYLETNEWIVLQRRWLGAGS